MRIAVFTDTYDQINGVAITYQELTGYCRQHCINVDIYTQSRHKAPDSIEEKGTVRIHRFKPALPVRWDQDMYFDLQIPNPRIRHYFQQGNYHFIHSAATGSMGINARYLARRYQVPLVGSFNTDLPQYAYTRVMRKMRMLGKPAAGIIARGFRALTWSYLKAYYKGCVSILAPSEYSKLMLEKKLRAPVALFTRGADPKIFHPRRRDPEFRDRHPGILALYVGRLAPEKNISEWIEVCRDIADITPVVVGEGPLEKDIRERIPRTVFTGPIHDRRRLAAIYASCDLFVFPSRTETFGQVICEAGMAGLPRIVSQFGASREQITHGVDGFVYSSSRDLKDYIRLLVSDPERRMRMGRKARQLAMIRSWDSIFDKLFEHYGLLKVELDLAVERVPGF